MLVYNINKLKTITLTERADTKEYISYIPLQKFETSQMLYYLVRNQHSINGVAGNRSAFSAYNSLSSVLGMPVTQVCSL